MTESTSERGLREQQLDELIAEYYQAEDRGEPLDQAAFLDRHPDFAAELRDFFADVGKIEQAAAPRSFNPVGFSLEGSRSSRGAALHSGTKVQYFGDYEVLEVLGTGGMGVVYKARQCKLKKIVALKLIKVGQLASEEQVLRFQAEARAAAKLDNPGIVAVHEVGMYQGQHYYTMDYLGGGSLAKLNRDEPVASRRAAEIVRQLAETMHYAHSRGIVHRDLKPANVLLTTNGAPRIADFGLAKRLWSNDDSTGGTMTETGQVLGTAGYMSPEQAAGKNRLILPSTDIYSLGAILYAMLTGRAPFVGESQADTLLQVIQNAPVSPRTLNPSISRDLEIICLKCLQKEPHRRYGTAQMLADDLGRWLQGRPIRARRVGPVERLWLWSQRRRSFVGTSLVFLLLALVGIAVGTLVSLERLNATRAAGLVAELRTADMQQVPGVIERINGYRRWAGPLLNTQLSEASQGSSERLRLALALLPVDRSQVVYLRDQLPLVSASQFPVVRDALLPYREDLVEPLWQVALNTSHAAQPRFQAACALATYAPQDKRWRQVSPLVAEHLVTRQTADHVAWREALRPAHEQLLEPLSRIYRNSLQREQPRLLATETLADFAAEQPAVLVDLLADAEHFQFPILLAQLSPESAVTLVAAELAKQPPADATELEKEHLAKRRASAAIALCHLGAEEQAWPILKHSDDPRARSYFIHWLSLRGGTPQIILTRWKSEPNISIRRGLLFTLGEFTEAQLPAVERRQLIPKLLAAWDSEPDAGLRAAAEWLLRSWGEGERMEVATERLRTTQAKQWVPLQPNPKSPDGEQRNWFLTPEGQTMVVLPPATITVGSPETELDRLETETVEQVTIERPFAIAAHEVTRAQMRRFAADYPDFSVFDDRKTTSAEDTPCGFLTWFEATAYCNWLSKQELIPQDEWCYAPTSAQHYAPGMTIKPDATKLTGYRLPTNIEWEYACRANTITPRYYGSSDALLPKYGWSMMDAYGQVWPVGALKPNEFGLFDMLGSESEWTHDLYLLTSRQSRVPVRLTTQEITTASVCYLRGGSHFAHPSQLRSAYKPYYGIGSRMSSLGFRVARTMPAKAPETSDGATSN
ncbi:SUMF1/EgtB/PvdO family nonheme iron enzyme [Anatilimnocola sp. NA78]|uniref:protein kinase domain-containing protein n=1 Tax=Anatilimnocola sp. NA78 TaxID=3415683 RepID=UPI003CE5B28F